MKKISLEEALVNGCGLLAEYGEHEYSDWTCEKLKTMYWNCAIKSSYNTS
jgi:hypothetical protein